MSDSREPTEIVGAELDEQSWLAGHIGRLAGAILGAIAIGFLAFLAVLGFPPAIGLLVVIVAGFLMIALGGAMRGTMRSH